MLYKENKKGSTGTRGLKKNGRNAKSRRIPFFNERDYKIYAAVNGITV